MTGRSFAGWDFCVGIARALEEPPEKLFRLAGLLPKLPPAVEEEREALGILRQLPAATRQNALAMLRALASTRNPVPLPAIAEAPTPYNPTEDQLERDLLLEFRKLPDQWQQEALRELERLHRLSTLQVRIIGDESEEQSEHAQRQESKIQP